MAQAIPTQQSFLYHRQCIRKDSNSVETPYDPAKPKVIHLDPDEVGYAAKILRVSEQSRQQLDLLLSESGAWKGSAQNYSPEEKVAQAFADLCLRHRNIFYNWPMTKVEAIIRRNKLEGKVHEESNPVAEPDEGWGSQWVPNPVDDSWVNEEPKIIDDPLTIAEEKPKTIKLTS